MLISGTLLQNRYRIVQPLGSGGQGAVYLAQHLGLNAYVAIKESFSNDPMANAQFQTEANLLAHLAHPNLPRVTDFFIEPNDARYLVMEYVQGNDLEKMVQQRGAPIPENEALNWFRQIFDAVKYLHANHVIHRDIKPQNIIITPNGRAVLVDFGIAKVMASGALTGASMRFGSPGYAPPEQYSGGTDERSDIYALGATLYFALTGQTPPEAPMRASGAKVIPPRQINSAISGNVERAVLKAMSLGAAQRQQTIFELDGMLQGSTANTFTLPARKNVQPNTLPNFLNRWIIGGGLAFLVLVALFGFILFPRTTPASQPTVLISAPPSGSFYTLGEQVAVQSTATDPNGVTQVELVVDGVIVQSDSSPVAEGERQFSVIQFWVADSVGQHTITVRAFNSQNASSESGIRIQVQSLGTTATPMPPTAIYIPTAPPLPPQSTEIPTIPAEPTAAHSPTVTIVVVTAVPPVTVANCISNSKFVADLTIPDGTIFTPSAVFNKAWRVQNTGTCVWDNYSLEFVSGTQMSASNSYPVPLTAPGATADFIVPMTAPINYGRYTSTWSLRDANGQPFGSYLTVVINVPTPPTPVPATRAILAQNLAPNPSFEQGASSPNQWNRDLFQYAQMDFENVVSHSGSKSLSITTPACNTEGIKYRVRWTSDPINVKPNANYFLSVWVRSERPWASTDGSANMGFGIPLVKEFLPTQEWTQVGFTFTPQTDKVRLELGLFSGECNASANKIYFDDIEFGE